MRFDFDTPIERRHTSSLKWDLYRGRDILPLWVADMDFRCPPAVIEALEARVGHGIFGYTHAPDELVGVIREMLLDQYAWDVHPEWLVWLPGVVSGLNLSCRCAGEAGDGVLTCTPVYPPFLSAPKHAGQNLKAIALAEGERGYVIDRAALKSARTSRTRLFMLCNPHNPGGRCFSREELAGLAEFCLHHDLTICSDEIHAGLVLDDVCTHIPIATLGPEVERRTITLLSPSKSFNIPGLGFAFAVIADPGLRRRFQRAMAGLVPHVNALGYVAALAAYRDGAPWLAGLREYLRGNREVVAGRVAAMPGLKMHPVEATYLAWIDARSLELDDPVGFFEQAGVGLSDGAHFGAPGFVRLNFGCPRGVLQEALGRMEAGLRALGAG